MDYKAPLKWQGGDHYTLDDGLYFYENELEYIQAKIYEVKHIPITYERAIPVSNEAGPFAEHITYESIEMATEAQFQDSSSSNMPLADINLSRTTQGVLHAALGYKYTLQELRTANNAGKHVDARRAQAVETAVQRLAQNTAFGGAAQFGRTGLINDANVGATANAGPAWSAATADQIIGDVNQALDLVWNGSNSIEIPDTILVPTPHFSLLSNTLVGVEHNKSLLEVLETQNIYYANTGQKLEIIPWIGLNDFNGADDSRLVAYRKDPEVLTFHFPMPLTFAAPQPRNLEVIVPGEFRIGGTEIRYPGAIHYLDNI